MSLTAAINAIRESHTDYIRGLPDGDLQRILQASDEDKRCGPS